MKTCSTARPNLGGVSNGSGGNNGGGDGCGGRTYSKRTRNGPKVPKRGLGVAELEKILKEQEMEQNGLRMKSNERTSLFGSNTNNQASSVANNTFSTTPTTCSKCKGCLDDKHIVQPPIANVVLPQPSTVMVMATMGVPSILPLLSCHVRTGPISPRVYRPKASYPRKVHTIILDCRSARKEERDIPSRDLVQAKSVQTEQFLPLPIKKRIVEESNTNRAGQSRPIPVGPSTSDGFISPLETREGVQMDSDSNNDSNGVLRRASGYDIDINLKL